MTNTVGIPASATMDMQATATTTGGTLSFGRDTPVPADFVTFINDTQWDRGNHWKLQARHRRRKMNGCGRASSPPGRDAGSGKLGAGSTCSASGRRRLPTCRDRWHTYLSLPYWAQGPVISRPSGLTSIPQAQFTTDADTCIFDDRLMVEGSVALLRREGL